MSFYERCRGRTRQVWRIAYTLSGISGGTASHQGQQARPQQARPQQAPGRFLESIVSYIAAAQGRSVPKYKKDLSELVVHGIWATGLVTCLALALAYTNR